MDLQEIMNSGALPLITAFLLGLKTSVCPCPMITNITAIGFIGKDIKNKNKVFLNGIYYAIGGAVAYTLLAYLLIPIVRKGLSIYAVQKAISSYGEALLPIVLMLFGVVMIVAGQLNLPSLHLFKKDKRLKEKGAWGSLLLGILFAMAFCPTTALIYFGLMIPLSAAEANGFVLPLAYSLASIVPVVLVAWVLAFSMASIGRLYNKIQVFEKWFKWIVSIIFIAIGIYFAISYW